MSTPFTTAAAAAQGEPAATDNQVAFVADLLARRDLSALTGKTAERVLLIGSAIAGVTEGNYITGERGEMVNRHLERPLTKAGASKLIELLKALPASAPIKATPADLPSADVVPAGCYALDTKEGALNETVFYRVDRPEEGRWAGRVFVKRLEGGDREIRVPVGQVAGILERIASVGAEEAFKAYGRLTRVCGVCGKSLTNDESRAYGIGPKCRQKF